MRWLISVLVVLALVAGLWWMEQRKQAELTPRPGIELPSEAEMPEPRHPLPRPEPPAASDDEVLSGEPEETPVETLARPEVEPLPPLPDLADSDARALEALAALVGNDFVQRWVRPEFVISRTVAIVNSLDGPAPALKTRPLETLDSEPLTEEVAESDALHWTVANADRYDALVGALETASPEAAADAYGRYYPLFQQAWDELGEPEPWFNDRLIDVIDHLLAAPEIALPFEVVRHEGRLHFAEEALQEESWGRKLLIRMGTEHAGRIKEWLRRFRNVLTEAADPAGD